MDSNRVPKEPHKRNKSTVYFVEIFVYHRRKTRMLDIYPRKNVAQYFKAPSVVLLDKTKNS